ncbi:MAG: LysR family transcriptional regulator, partial [Hyphomicrobiales bacterium]
MRRLPPLVELRAFEAAARCLSFKKAAAELGVTPTAISHQVKLLEHFCGTPLFRRRPRPLALTPVGEQLYPGIRDGFERIGQALGVVQERDVGARLRISATNAFAAHWLIPRLPHWRTTHPRLKLSIIGTDAVLDLKAGDIDISIRYARKPPSDGEHVELMRDIFYVVASPSLVGSDRKVLKPAELATLPLIEAEWPAADVHAPNWKRWQKAARSRYKNVPDLAALSS